MSESSSSLSDQIDDRIDRRIPQLQDSIELKLTKQVDSLLKDRFESATKLLGWTFGLVALAFTGFGVKTFFDIREVARSSAIEEVKKKLALDDPNSEFRRDVDKVIARGLINSYYLELNRNKDKRFRPDMRIAEVDLRRLLDLATDPRTSERDFIDACEVMFRSAQSNEDHGPVRTLTAMGIAADEPFRWIRDQPEKRAAIFELAKNEKLVPTARALIADGKTDKALVVAATRYLSKQNDKDSAKPFEKLADSSDEKIRQTALNGLATIAPNSTVLNNTLFPVKNDDDSISASVRLAIVLAKSSNRGWFEKDPFEELRLETASRVIQNAITKDFVFRLSSSFNGRGGSGLAISSRSNLSTLYGLSSDLLLGSQVRTLDYLLKKAAKDDALLAKTLRAFCLEDNEKCWGVVNVQLDGGGKLVLKNGITVDNSNAPAGVSLRPESPSPDAKILAVWTDPTAISKTSNLEKIIAPEKMQFEVAAIKTISSRDEDE